MTNELGRMQKPEAEPFRRSRKLYLVPLVLYREDSPEGLRERCQRYWNDVEQHLANLESKIGPIRHIFHESIVIGGNAGLEVMSKFNPDGWRIAAAKCQSGAVLELLEDRELAEEAMDWERCLMIGFMSEKVASKVSEFLAEATRKRYDHIARTIDDSLKDEEAGVIFIREGHHIQFPKTIEVFIVFPPSLDDLHRWLRDQASTGKESTAESGSPNEKTGNS